MGLTLAVYGVLRSGTWGWVQPKPDAPELFGISAVFWLIVSGLLVLYAFMQWQNHLKSAGREPLIDPALFGNAQLTGGVIMFFFQFLIQAGVFFVVPLFLSVVLELSALETGLRILPLSVALLISAAGIPKMWPEANPRRVVRLGFLSMLGGILLLVGGMDLGASAAVVYWPMLLMGLGLGALASQLGAVTVSAVPDDRAPEVGGLQNTGTNLGASLGTALIGSVLIAALTSAAIAGIQNNPDVPDQVEAAATTELSSGVSFISDTQLEAALDEAGVDPATAAEITEVNAEARLQALQVAFAAAALLTVLALMFTGRLPTTAPGAKRPDPVST